MSKSKSSSGISITMVLFIIFLVLKLTNNIDWSWWWVTSPLWIPVALAFSLICLIIFAIVVAVIFGTSLDDIRQKIEHYKEKYKD